MNLLTKTLEEFLAVEPTEQELKKLGGEIMEDFQQMMRVGGGYVPDPNVSTARMPPINFDVGEIVAQILTESDDNDET